MEFQVVARPLLGSCYGTMIWYHDDIRGVFFGHVVCIIVVEQEAYIRRIIHPFISKGKKISKSCTQARI